MTRQENRSERDRQHSSKLWFEKKKTGCPVIRQWYLVHRVLSSSDLIDPAGQKAGNVIIGADGTASIRFLLSHCCWPGAAQEPFFKNHPGVDTNIRARFAVSDRFRLNPLIRFPLFMSRLPDPQTAGSDHWCEKHKKKNERIKKIQLFHSKCFNET